ncbi:hypothetical protein K488DRAFT_90558 [Vararia minispora EC-137]|uniref:Uncharacterized protein n=1 Tax=Vararia minispora EC-137 TaxID=1314806 RepID=A0ACB8Q7J9_9AGAM|nr:hypothetical protein K488DRAFT_90558 [Vararia minispora EC-137]
MSSWRQFHTVSERLSDEMKPKERRSVCHWRTQPAFPRLERKYHVPTSPPPHPRIPDNVPTNSTNGDELSSRKLATLPGGCLRASVVFFWPLCLLAPMDQIHDAVFYERSAKKSGPGYYSLARSFLRAEVHVEQSPVRGYRAGSRHTLQKRISSAQRSARPAAERAPTGVLAPLQAVQ